MSGAWKPVQKSSNSHRIKGYVIKDGYMIPIDKKGKKLLNQKVKIHIPKIDEPLDDEI